MKIKNSVFLSTYPDSLGGSLSELEINIERHFKGLFGGIHILPFYPSSGDRGFAPRTHLEVEPEFGTWKNIRALSQKYSLMSDLVSGHISTSSYQFKDYLNKGEKSDYADLFFPVEKIAPNKMIHLDQLIRFCELLPRPQFIRYDFEDGTSKLHFNTFLPIQAELDPSSPLTKEMLQEAIASLAQRGITYLRLDAIDTVHKALDRGMYLLEETFEHIQWLIDECQRYDITPLSEVHDTTDTKRRIIAMGSTVYDFKLPGIALNAVYRKEPRHLKEWFSECPAMFSIITNHDGIRIGMSGEELNETEDAFTLEQLIKNAGEFVVNASFNRAGNIVDNAVNAPLMSAVNENLSEWLFSYCINLFGPGRPIIYYNDLLAAMPDKEAFFQFGEGRALIRHNFSNVEIEHQVSLLHIQKLIEAIRLRNSEKAFDGKFSVENNKIAHQMILNWKHENVQAQTFFDFKTTQCSITLTADDGSQKTIELCNPKWFQ